MTHFLAVFWVLLLSWMAFTSCKEPATGPETPTDSLVLKLKEADLTSVTLSLHTAGLNYPAALTLTRNSQPVQTFSLNQPDTTLLDTALTPSTGYSWQVLMKKTETAFLKSDAVTGRTMDTTSHEFTWRMDTLGCAGSILWDVAIVNDTCVWVVGDLFTKPYDSFERYNAAMWNGKVWKKFRFKLAGFNGFESVHDLKAVFYSPDNKLIVSSGGSFNIHEVSGKRLYTAYLDKSTGSTSKIWGTSSSNLYLVGSNGSITRYNGNTFTLMESGTMVDLLDVWGTPNGEVWACGYNSSGEDLGHSILLEKSGQSWTLREDDRFTGNGTPPGDKPKDSYQTIWFPDRGDSLFVGTAWGVFKRKLNPESKSRLVYRRNSWFEFPPPEMGFPFRIRGTGSNDIWVAGDYCSLIHFNGSTWRQLPELFIQSAEFRSLDARGRLVTAVGLDYRGSAVCYTLTR